MCEEGKEGEGGRASKEGRKRLNCCDDRTFGSMRASVTLDFVMDEGGMVTKGVVDFTPRPVALIGIGEKGYLTVELEVTSEGGHSSMPARPTAIGQLSAALVALEQNPMPASLRSASLLLAFLAPELPWVSRMAIANPFFFESLLLSQLSSQPATNAAVRTTTAPTMLSGSAKDNVMPRRVTATINFRILPGDTIESVLQHVRSTINNPAIKVRYGAWPLPFHPLFFSCCCELMLRSDCLFCWGCSYWKESANEPSPLSDPFSPQFKLVQSTLHQLLPDVLVAPYLVVGGTDSYYFTSICKNVFRFIPYTATPSDLPRLHGVNERISLEDIRTVIQWQYQLIRNADQIV